MLLVRVRLEIREVNGIALRCDAGSHDRAVVVGVYAPPVLTVFASQHLVALPASGVGGFGGIHEPQSRRLTRCTLQAKVKPLGELGSRVGADTQLDVVRHIRTHHLNGTGIELRGNRELGHGQNGR